MCPFTIPCGHACCFGDEGGEQAARVGLAGAGQCQRGAMVDRCADDGQAEGDIDAVAKRGVLERGQPLIVVHGQHGIIAGEYRRVNRVSAG